MNPYKGGYNMVCILKGNNHGYKHGLFLKMPGLFQGKSSCNSLEGKGTIQGHLGYLSFLWMDQRVLGWLVE